MNIPKQSGGDVSRAELYEWLIIIAIIISWWPRFFLGWSNVLYLALIYVGDPLVLVVILVRRWRRMNEGFDLSKTMIDSTRQAQEQAEEAEKVRRREERRKRKQDG